MTVPIAWMELKDTIVALTGWSRNSLHIGLGLMLFLAAAAPARARTASLRAWLFVLAIALSNEAIDLRNDIMFSGVPGYAESWHDVTYTMMLPSLVLLWTHTALAFTQYRRAPRRRTAWI
jgi:hypothetical protein